MNSFVSIVINSAELSDPNLAVVAAQTGAVGVLDLEFCPQNKLTLAAENLKKLISLTQENQKIGLRLHQNQILAQKNLLELLKNRDHWLILTGWESQNLATDLGNFPKAVNRQVLLEVLDPKEAVAIEKSLVQVDGIVAKGHESGGWVSEDSAFILTQNLVKVQQLPIYVQGGIGIHTAAAVRAAGAAGVVLDDQLWLMPESPLDPKIQRLLKNLSGQEAIAIGERLGKTCRVLFRPGFTAVKKLQKLAEDSEIQQADAQTWQQQANTLIGWSDPENFCLPMGQGVGLAAGYQSRYQTTSNFLKALSQASAEHLETANQYQPLQANSPLAVSHGTKYPIMQGPMTRVSDVAEFANAVSQAGALPMLALALMRKEQVKSLLYKAKDLIGNRAWGIGILGFVPQNLREAQLEVVKEVKPPFALIAGGRPDQAARLEAEGIATYIHVPTPALLKMFLEQGARRFVFEGRECGGHVGPLSSWILWSGAIQTLLEEVPAGAEEEIHVFFAGGIHDRLSAAMIAAMAAPLAARGMRFGVLMGTAYILTEEAVQCGAILPGFQQEILSCQKTINLETGPGHASRCAVTPFAKEFYETRRRMAANGSSPDEIKEVLEDLTLGRLRIASKGLTRDSSGQIVTVSEEKQVAEGMYMIGQVATLRDQSYTLAELHADVAENSTKWLQEVNSSQLSVNSNQLSVNSLSPNSQSQVTSPKSPIPSHQSQVTSPQSLITSPQSRKPSEIAIVGIATLLPKADNPEQYWDNIVNKVDAIAEIPGHRWDWRLYYDESRQTRDKIYSKWGGFLDDVSFDPLRFGIPPKSLKSIEPMQLLTLEAVRRALADAGYEKGNFDRENTSVILGCGGGIGDLGQQYATRSEIPRFVGQTNSETWDRLPEWTEESFPGVLLNVVAGRVASRFDFGGSNFTVDAACASSLAAIDLAVKELETGVANVAIAGGVDTVQSPFAFFCFSKTQALSPRGKCRTFDQTADGIAISEGIAIVVLKRLADAERDGDRIYSVIKAVASSSDGKALGLTAPLPAGQRRAVKRAYTKADLDPKTIALYEAHGTGTVAGDRAELETWLQTLTLAQAASKSCAIGSVKTGIGHTKSSAGVAGLIKVALSLHHQVKPPHMNVEKPLEAIADPESPVYLLKEAQPWIANPNYPRRGSISAFGFGGTNFHAVLEEYSGNQSPVGGQNWSWELLVFRSENRDKLSAELTSLKQALAMGAKPCLRDLAYSYAQQAQAKQKDPVCLTIVAASLAQLETDLTTAIAYLRTQNSPPLPLQIQYGEKAIAGEIAFLFSGQGSQYPQMAREVALYFPEMRAALAMGDRHLQAYFTKPISQYIYPASAYDAATENHQNEQLKDTKIAQPAIGTIELGFLHIAAKLGLQPVSVAGHSYGEYAALHAAGVLSEADFLRLSAIRGKVMAAACDETEGGMAAAQITREELLSRLKGFDGVVIANHNAPLQSVISGDRQAVAKVVENLQASGIKAMMLPVAGAFHTPLVAAASKPLADAIANTAIASPQIPVYANATARCYPNEATAIKKQLSKHLLSTVEFVSQIEQMYADGARVFIELGPKSILTKLSNQTLAEKEHLCVSFDSNGGGLRGFLSALASLATRSVDFNLPALFTNREVQQLDLSNLVETTQEPPLPKTAWLVNGGNARPHQETIGYTGKLPPLNQATVVNSSATTSAKVKANPLHNSQPKLIVNNGHNNSEPPATTTAKQLNNSQLKPNGTASFSPSNNSGKNAQFPVKQVTNNYSQTQVSSAMKTTNNQNQHLPMDADQLSHQTNALAGYQAYQETMRQFLQLQEKVMQQFLASVQSEETVSPPTHQTNGNNGNNGKNGNGNHLLTVPDGNLTETDSSRQPNFSVPTNFAPQAQQEKPPHRENIPQEKVVEKLAATPEIETFAPDLTVTYPAKTAPEIIETNNSSAQRENLIQILVELVSDRTGYPPEMLGLDQDLEAELGIDSIKRVEILGAFQKALNPDISQQLNQEMENLTRAKTLNSLVDQLLAQAQNSQVETVATPPPPVQVSPEKASSVQRENLIQTLVELVSDRTGYPPEMLGLDQDLEAELGIDSIKRVEILGAFQKALEPNISQQLNQEMENLTRAKTLNSLVDKLIVEEVCLGKPNGEVLSTLINSASPRLPRYQIQSVESALTTSKLALAPGLFLITEDRLFCAKALASALAKKEVETAIIKRKTLLDPVKLAAKIDQLRSKFGAVHGIIHLVGIESNLQTKSLTKWREYAGLHSKSLFQLLKLCASDLQEAGKQKQAFVLSASLLGGYFGRQGEIPGLATNGAAVGLLKTLVTEWSGVQAKVVDFDTSLSPRTISQKIIEELLSPGRLEVGYPEGKRTIFPTVAAPLAGDSKQLTPDKDWVVLVTGGLRGITAEITTDLAKVGLKLAIAGKSPYPEPESPETAGIEDLSKLRQILIQQAINSGEKPTPVAIETKLKKLQRNRAMHLNLERFRSYGATVEYYSADVRNESEFGSVIQTIYQRHGKIDAVIHGAGIIEDKLIVDKTLASFDKVFDTKADSIYLLSKYLQSESLQLLVLFSSVAGRYGNKGQCDYAAANEVMNRFAWQLNQQWSNTRVVAINWGPWDTKGMASESVKRQFRDRGIIPIPLEAGRQFFLNEILYGSQTDVEIVAGEGPWETYEAARENEAENGESPLPLLQKTIPQLQPNGSVTLEYSFSLETDPYLKDHQLDGKPVLPAAGALELIAEFVQAAWEDWQVTQVRDLRVFRGLVLEGKSKTVWLQAKASTHADATSTEITAEILDPEKKIPYYRATVVLQPQLEASPQLEISSLSGGQKLAPDAAYQNYLFHGASFQLVTGIERLNQQGIDAEVKPSNAQSFLSRNTSQLQQLNWLFDPGLIDTAPQLAIVWARVQQETTALPSRFGRVTRYLSAKVAQPLKMAWRVIESSLNTLTYDAILFDEMGNIHFYLENIESTCNSQLNRLAAQ
ncbi:MAG: SDR family NAD(P)-dependent oxidoreductase [Oscillatoria sp. PMC 1068.18]|nr:SDR family NAD(P)-dependent oxidoreductase [Oscillatoria sp. PMC 1076.18]MEC4987618.1 SDR family NAD(P)-dependent oxidoreductase [Oscillatoria sp. PMC 1068.18]